MVVRFWGWGGSILSIMFTFARGQLESWTHRVEDVPENFRIQLELLCRKSEEDATANNMEWTILTFGALGLKTNFAGFGPRLRTAYNMMEQI